MNHPLTFGEVVCQIKTAHFLTTEALHPAGLEIAPHVHALPSAAFAVTGVYEERVRGARAEGDLCTLIFKRAGERHSNRYHGDCRSVIIAPASGCAEGAEITSLLDRTRVIRSGHLRGRLLRIWRESKRSDRLRGLALDGAVLLLLAELLSEPAQRADDAVLARAVDLLHGSIGETVELNTLAAASGLPVRTFLRRFKAKLGCSPAEYARRLRVDRAKQRLRESSCDLRALALELGFYDQSHFTNDFKMRVGVSPSEFRRES